MTNKDEDLVAESSHSISTKSPTGEPRTLIGQYRLDNLVADGEFAQMWRGYDLERQQIVAVKLFKSGRPESADPFLVQACKVAHLKHPGIVPIHEVKCEDETCFIVSDFFEGGSLIDFIGRHILSSSQAIRRVTDIAEALEYAHENGVIHGDIKPANILIGDHGRALLADFGFARSANAAAGLARPTGIHPYLSPEQFEGKVVGPQSDIYSLGVVFYELLTGKIPYASSDPVVLRQEILSGAKLGLVSMPAKLRHICMKALEHDPNRRYSSAAQLVDDLRKCTVESSTRRVIVGAIGAVLFVIGFTIAGLWPAKPPKPSGAKIETAWIAHVATLSANEQAETVAAKLVELNKGFNGEVKETIEQGALVGLEVLTDELTDISPVQALTGLTSLNCSGTYTSKSNGKLADLSPLHGLKLTNLSCDFNEGIGGLTSLQGMPLTYLNCARTNVADLAPLRNMPLAVLICSLTQVSNLSPLTGLKLKEFSCDHTRVDDLTPLEGMPLEQFNCSDTPVVSLTPLRGAPLKRLECYKTGISDLTPLRGMSELSALNIFSTKVDDLSVLKELPHLELLWCDFVEERDAELLRSLKSLTFINNNPVAVFWKELDEKPSSP